MRRAFAFALASAMTLACDSGTTTLLPLGQIVLFVSTDAPLPAPAGLVVGASVCPSQPPDVPALFDALRIDVYDASQHLCAECSRTFAVDCALVDGGRASVGIQPPVGASGYVARVRLFRSPYVANDEPLPSAAIDAFVALPPVPAEGKIDVTVDLPTDGVGAPSSSLSSPEQATLGTPPSGRVGTWPPAHRTSCTQTPGPGEACLPGGAYWMGNPNVVGVLASVDANVPHLVTLSPFILDAAEVSVGAFRASGVAVPADTATLYPGDPFDTTGTPGGCQYSSTPAGNDAMPANCVTWARAHAYCSKLGKDLVTEAQFEYVASGLAGHTYVWGENDPACADAVFARGGTPSIPVSCTTTNAPAAPGSGTLDRIMFGSAAVVDLAANLREWARDDFVRSTPCWTAAVLHDPVCNTQGGTNERAVRGGGWRDEPSFLRAATRHFGYAAGDPNNQNVAGFPTAYYDDYGRDLNGEGIGFRCSRSGT